MAKTWRRVIFPHDAAKARVRLASSVSRAVASARVLYIQCRKMVAAMNVAVTTAAEGFPRRAFTVEDIGRMIEAGVIREDERFDLVEGEIVIRPPYLRPPALRWANGCCASASASSRRASRCGRGVKPRRRSRNAATMLNSRPNDHIRRCRRIYCRRSYVLCPPNRSTLSLGENPVERRSRAQLVPMMRDGCQAVYA